MPDMLDADALYFQALERRYAEDFGAASQLLEQGIHCFPDDQRFILDYCKLAMNQQQWQEAIHRFEHFKSRAINADYFIFFSICYERLGDFDTAKYISAQAFTQFPNSLELLLHEIRLDFERLLSTDSGMKSSRMPTILTDERIGLLQEFECSQQSIAAVKQRAHLLWLHALYTELQESTWLLNISGTGTNTGRYGLVNASGGLYMPRQADDWSEEKNGIKIERQDNLNKGITLSLLKANPYPGLANVLDFDMKTVLVEYVQGIIFSHQHRFAPRQWQHSYISAHTKAELPPYSLLQDTVSHLHAIGVAHTDITGYNIMVSDQGILKLIDLLGTMPLDERLRQWDLQKLRECMLEFYR